ncbi:MAG: hypothetical protein HXY38_05175 [Chloroflexi bacterium]|nr:hypothetical protein [Chloroflexota bacterium]
MDLSLPLPEVESLPSLLTELEALNQYEAAAALRPNVEAEIQRLQRLARGLDVEGARAAQALNTYKKEHAAGALRKLFNNGSRAEAELKGHVEEVQRAREEVYAALRRLQDAFDFTPYSELERAGILKELRLRKKALLERGHRITHVAHGPRLNQNLHALPPGVDANAFERRKTRYARESEPRPGEDGPQALARQLAWIEDAIRWVERFPAGE